MEVSFKNAKAQGKAKREKLTMISCAATTLEKLKKHLGTNSGKLISLLYFVTPALGLILGMGRNASFNAEVCTFCLNVNVG